MGKELKVRKIGNSVGVILPSSLGLKAETLSKPNKKATYSY